jgi:chromosome segregation ATPase
MFLSREVVTLLEKEDKAKNEKNKATGALNQLKVHQKAVARDYEELQNQLKLKSLECEKLKANLDKAKGPTSTVQESLDIPVFYL